MVRNITGIFAILKQKEASMMKFPSLTQLSYWICGFVKTLRVTLVVAGGGPGPWTSLPTASLLSSPLFLPALKCPSEKLF